MKRCILTSGARRVEMVEIEMPAFPLLWPAVALALITFAVSFAVVAARIGHRRRNPPRQEDFATRDTARSYYGAADRPNDNLGNLFEMPVLFYTLIILLLLTELANDVQVALAWAYVVLRATHSWFHLRGKVKQRFLSFALSNAVLLVMWTGFAADTFVAARAYSETMQTLDAQPLP